VARQVEPDLVITDIKMPGLDGLQAAEVLGRERDIPILLVSAYHDADLLTRAAAGPVMAYLTKPAGADDLEAAIAVALARFRACQVLCREAADLQQALEQRKLIERAKGALLRRLRLDEAEGSRRLRRLATNDNLKLVEVARRVLQAEEVFREMEHGAPPSRPAADAP
jgi:response regulator NasT